MRLSDLADSVRRAANDSANGLLRVLLGPECVGCGSTLERPLRGAACEDCWHSIARLSSPLCAICGDVLLSLDVGPHCRRCASRQPAIRLARSAGRYDGSLRLIIHAFKYERRRALATPLAQLMSEAGASVLNGADAAVPVPLSWRRALTRGFNQADDLARQLELPVWRVLRRAKHGPPQAGLPAAKRLTNVHDAFALRRRPAGLQDRVFVLIDDVMTTGATLDACASVLMEAGAREVRALTIARAVAVPPASLPPPPRPSTARRR